MAEGRWQRGQCPSAEQPQHPVGMGAWGGGCGVTGAVCEGVSGRGVCVAAGLGMLKWEGV